MKTLTSVNILLHSKSETQSEINKKVWDGTTFYWDGGAQNGKRHSNYIFEA